VLWFYILIKIQVIKMKPLFVFSNYNKHIIFLTHREVGEGGIVGHAAINHTRRHIVIAAKRIGAISALTASATATTINNTSHIYSYKKVLNIICYNKIHILYNTYPG
jgi:hypothetical protein